MSGFYRVGEPGEDAIVHLNTGRRSSGPRCVMPRFPEDNPSYGEICGRLTVALCDHRVSPPNAAPVTCDAAICELHRVKHLTEPNTDFCPDHKPDAERIQGQLFQETS